MKEIRILVERDRLLPVRYAQFSHDDLQQQFRESPVADADQLAWKKFTDTVEGITYVRSEEEYTGEGLIKKGQRGTLPCPALEVVY